MFGNITQIKTKTTFSDEILIDQILQAAATLHMDMFFFECTKILDIFFFQKIGF